MHSASVNSEPGSNSPFKSVVVGLLRITSSSHDFKNEGELILLGLRQTPSPMLMRPDHKIRHRDEVTPINSLVPSLSQGVESSGHPFARKTFVKEQKNSPGLLSASQEARGKFYFAVDRSACSDLTLLYYQTASLDVKSFEKFSR